MPTYRACQHCGVSKDPSGAKYCTAPACQAVRRENQYNSPKKRAVASRLRKAEWAEWKRLGINPTNENGAGQRRGAKIAVSNSEKPRRKRKTDET